MSTDPFQWQSMYGAGTSDSISMDFLGGMERSHTEGGHTDTTRYGYADGVTEVPAWTVTKVWDYAIEVSDPLGQITMSMPTTDDVGCFHMRQYHNGETQWDQDTDEDYLHICDLEEHIEMLRGLVEFLRLYKAGEIVATECVHAHCRTKERDGVVTERRCQTCGAIL